MRRITTPLKIIAAFTISFAMQTTVAQDLPNSQKALSLVKKNAAAIGLTEDNILNSRITDTYEDALSGNTLVYLQQTYIGIDVDKVVQVLAFKNGTLVSSAGKQIDLRLVKAPAASNERKAVTPSVSPENAIQAAAQHLHLSVPSVNKKSVSDSKDFSKATDFGDLGIAKENITTRLLWVPQKTFERIKLVWEVNLSPKKSSDSWRVIIDAKTGNVIKKENYTVPDNWNKINKEEKALEKIKNTNDVSLKKNNEDQTKIPERITSATYRVIPFPAEAPSFPKGSPSLVTDPWKLSPAGSGATPFIWNDDGSRQYKFTRGNNVLAQEDRNANDSVGKRAKGTVYKNNLYFDFMPDFSKPPTDSINQNFAITNLFYWNNILHDLSYQYGFDEVSGNFQQNNLGRGGKGYDFVYADAQDGLGLNNANFTTPPDGRNPRMQMYLFSDQLKRMKINTPASIAGNVISTESAVSPNNLLTDVGPVTADVVLYNDPSDTLNVACEPADNPDELKGKIALIYRGGCAFTIKILNAQNAGAIAVIVINNVPGVPPPTMIGLDSAITIPAVMISYEDGMKIRTVLDDGITVNVTLMPAPLTDGDLDNGVIAHEYGHGISNRLTGGPSNVLCLQNAEQMGEGWSDYIALMTTTDWRKAKKNDGNLPRTIGSYVFNQPPGGAGFRQYPYSTDFKVNPHTYADVATSGGQVHNIGEIWATTLWDMTWNIIEMDGINKDIFNSKGEGGNSVAFKLVMQGMKLQPCGPGFIDGRDAILEADTLLYNGKYGCAIWKAFARRGLGIGALQGSPDIAGDETPDFTLGIVYVTKHADKKRIAPGKELTYTIGLRAKAVCGGNIKQNYSVTDSLPGNVTYVSSDGVYNPATRTVSFGNIDMKDGDSITYKIKVYVKNNSSFPDSVYLNDTANTPQISDKWVIQNGNTLAWTTLDLGIYLYYSNDTTGRDEETLVTAGEFLVPGIKTTFSFFNYFTTDDFNNGGVVEITTDGGKNWKDLGPYMDPSGIVYTNTILGNSVLTGRKAFAGFGIGNTIIDLSPFAGKTVKIRFRYATSDNSFAVPNGGTGWLFADILLSASPEITNTARLLNRKNEVKGSSTVVTKIKGRNVPSADFVVAKNNAEALLTWRTPGENNNGTYQVERSVEKENSFRPIGTLNTVVGTADLQSYNFTDASPAEGVNQYRINHVNSGGVVNYSEIRSVVFNNLKAVNIFPNPAKDRVKVYIPGNIKAASLQLINSLGNRIKNYQMLGQNIELSLPALTPGVYYLNVIRNGSVSKHKIVIE